jgi:hypothetical protein
VVYTGNRIVFGLNKKQNSDNTCYKMGKPWKHCHWIVHLKKSLNGEFYVTIKRFLEIRYFGNFFKYKEI